MVTLDKNSRFSTNKYLYRTNYTNSAIVSIEGEWETVYQSFRKVGLPVSMTLSDLKSVFQGHAIIQR